MVRYIGVRKASAGWAKTARNKAQEVVDKIDENDAIFAIGGQRHVGGTPTTASLGTPGFSDLGEGSKVYKATITFDIEARRWS